MGEEKSSYRQIFKATSIFGGVQVFNILIAIIRSKVIAMLLGPAGMGISGLFTSATTFISGLTNFGLASSAVKNVAESHSSGDSIKTATTIIVLRRLVWLTGLLGTVVTIVLSPWLSQLSFGNKNYTWAFILLSSTLLINQINIGQNIVMQGMRQISYLAKASLLGSVFSLLLTLPFYYIWKLDGIVPALILTSLITLLLSWYFSSKTKIEKVKVSREKLYIEGKDMLLMGFMISLSALYVLAKNYGIRVFIGYVDNVEQVGLYTAGFAIINTYVGMVFTAMATDYYPRLSAIAGNNNDARILINQQAEVAVLILAPIISVFLVFIGWIVVLFYSSKFLPITLMMQWSALGMFFRASSWSVAFIFLAKGDRKLFLFNELFAGTITLIFQLGGYFLGGLTGMGIGFLLGYVYYTIQVYIIARKKYEFSFDKTFIRQFIAQFIAGSLCFLSVFLAPNPWNYIVGLPFIIVSLWYSYKELNKRIGIAQIIKSRLKRS